jgi:hypothetical protein
VRSVVDSVSLRLPVVSDDDKPSHLRCVSALALLFGNSKFPGAPTRRCRIRLQRPLVLLLTLDLGKYTLPLT